MIRQAGEREITGLVAERAADRAKWGHFGYRVEPYGVDPLAEARAAARRALEEKRRVERQIARDLITLRQNTTRGIVEPAGIPPHVILLAVTRATGYTKGALLGHSRMRPVVYARMLAYWLMRSLRPDFSLPLIGRLMGYRDHTTIKSGVEKIEELKLTPPVSQWLAHPAVRALFP